MKGEICIDLEDQPITKKQIVVSRTFSQRVTNQDLLNEAVSDYAARAGVKLRREKQVCKLLSVFIRTNPFRKQDTQHRQMISIPFINPTNDSRDLMYGARMAMKKIFNLIFNIIKPVLCLVTFYDEEVLQLDLFKSEHRSYIDKNLMKTIDRINKTSNGPVTFLSQGIKKEIGQ